MIIGSLARGGAERVVCTLTREWARAHDVRIVLFSADQVAYEHGGRIIDLHTGGSTSRVGNALAIVVRSVRLVALFLRFRPDQILSFMESASFPTVVAATVLGLSRRTQVSVRNNPSSIRYRYRALIPWVYRLPLRVVVPSSGIGVALRASGLPSKRVVVIPNPVDIAQIRRYNQPHPIAESYVLGAGRLVRQKGFDQLIRAFSLVNDSSLRLVILGAGPERRALRLHADQLGLGARVELKGAVSDIDRWYQQALCFVLSSRYEGWPNVLVEAMANGCPVISVNCPFGPAEILENGRFGLLVDRGDTQRLAAAISEMSMNPKLRREYVLAARQRAHEFDVRRVATRWFNPALSQRGF